MINKKIFIVSLIIFGLITSCFSFVANSDCVDCDENFNIIDRGYTWNKYFNSDTNIYNISIFNYPVNYLKYDGFTPIIKDFMEVPDYYNAYNYGYRY